MKPTPKYPICFARSYKVCSPFSPKTKVVTLTTNDQDCGWSLPHHVELWPLHVSNYEYKSCLSGFVHLAVCSLPLQSFLPYDDSAQPESTKGFVWNDYSLPQPWRISQIYSHWGTPSTTRYAWINSSLSLLIIAGSTSRWGIVLGSVSRSSAFALSQILDADMPAALRPVPDQFFLLVALYPWIRSTHNVEYDIYQWLGSWGAHLMIQRYTEFVHSFYFIFWVDECHYFEDRVSVRGGRRRPNIDLLM